VGKISPELEKLFIKHKGEDKEALPGHWDIASSDALRNRIDERMRGFLAIKSSARALRTVSKLQLVLGTKQYEILLNELTEAAKYLTAERLKLDDHRRGLASRSTKPGEQRKPELQILFSDVIAALGSIFG